MTGCVPEAARLAHLDFLELLVEDEFMALRASTETGGHHDAEEPQ